MSHRLPIRLAAVCLGATLLISPAIVAQQPSKDPSQSAPLEKGAPNATPEKGTSTPPPAEQAQAANTFGGIGVTVVIDQGITRITTALDNRPAAKAGLKAGDYITHIDKAIVIGLTREEITEKLRGTPNSPVTLTVLRKGHDEPIEVALMRELITIAANPTTRLAMPPLNELSGLQLDLAKLAQGTMSRFVVRKEPEPLPEFTFVDATGKTRSLKEWHGKIVALNIWATWCAPCLAEMPSLNRLKAKLGGAQFDVVALSVDRSGIERPRKFLSDIQANALEAFNNNDTKLPQQLKIEAYPTTILIGRDGREIGRLSSAIEWDASDAARFLETAIKPGS